MGQIVYMKFRKPDGTECRVRCHEVAAPAMRAHYEKKKYVYLGDPTETPADQAATPTENAPDGKAVGGRGRGRGRK